MSAAMISLRLSGESGGAAGCFPLLTRCIFQTGIVMTGPAS
jgi:hypothetical protein